MIQILKILILLNGFITYPFENKDEEAIRLVMAQQIECWNNGDLECFMQGYWHSDSLKFIGSRGISYGWESTLSSYQKGYPDIKTMGKLRFELISLEGIGKDYYFVVGKFYLTREIGNVAGHFSLLWKKVKGKWLIIADHSS